MSNRNVASLDRRMQEILNDLYDRVRRVERRRPTGTGSGICDCEDGATGPPGADGNDGNDGNDGRGVAVFEQAGQPTAIESAPGDIWIVP